MCEDLTLAVGDTHIGPKQSLRRAHWLGQFATKINPARIVFIGDIGTFDSLSAWDKDKRKKMEGRRFANDVQSIHDFFTIANLPKQSEIILIEGNHEYRIERYVDQHPEVENTLTYLPIPALSEHQVTVVPYKSFYKYKGVGFTHVPIMENGRPVSGKYATSRALDICNHSVVFGHTHKLDYKSVHRHGSPHLQEALNIGCFFEHIDEYALGSMTSYWRGLCVLDHYKRNRFSFSAVPLGLLKREYA